MYQKIMVPLDGSELAECVLPHLEAIASGCRITHVVLIEVIDPLQLPASVPARGDFGFTEKDRRELEERRKAAAQEYLQKIENALSIPGATFSHQVLEGKVSEALTEYAQNNDIDMIVIASHGRSGISRWLLGSVADRIVRSSCVPVLMVRAPGCEPRPVR
jgi:nucleotide-binding universal stress UspA family protein